MIKSTRHITRQRTFDRLRTLAYINHDHAWGRYCELQDDTNGMKSAATRRRFARISQQG